MRISVEAKLLGRQTAITSLAENDSGIAQVKACTSWVQNEAAAQFEDFPLPAAADFSL